MPIFNLILILNYIIKQYLILITLNSSNIFLIRFFHANRLFYIILKKIYKLIK